QRPQPRDHRLDPGTRLLVLQQQLRALAHQLLLLQAQAAVLVGQALATVGQRLDPRGEGAEAGIGVGRGFHGATIGSAPRAGQATPDGRPRGRRGRIDTLGVPPDPRPTCRNCPLPRRSPRPAASSAWPPRPPNCTGPCAAGWPGAAPTCANGPPG